MSIETLISLLTLLGGTIAAVLHFHGRLVKIEEKANTVDNLAGKVNGLKEKVNHCPPAVHPSWFKEIVEQHGKDIAEIRDRVSRLEG